MSTLDGLLADYLATRRALGYKLKRTEKLLRQFLTYLAERSLETITTTHALAWAMLPQRSLGWAYYRLAAVRGFACYVNTIDPACEVPPADLLPCPSHRATPYVYSEKEIIALLEATDTLRTAHRAATYRTLIGLLSVTGMRIGEAISLDRQDLDGRLALIVVRGAKFGKSRELPLHPTTLRVLRRYLARRDRPPSPQGSNALFVSGSGSRLLYCNVQWTFARLAAGAGIKPRSAKCRPRLHDLRHTFAVRTMLDAYRDANDGVAHRLTLLVTYLGHVDPSSTYWYLSAAPELMALAAQRLERHLGGAR